MGSTVTAGGNENLVERFIDKVEAVFVKAEPFALAAEPVLALTPAGPEYQVALNAIVGAQQVAQASLAAGTTLTGVQQAAIAVNAATPALNTILSSKGVTGSTEAVIGNWIQSVFGILAGPVAALLEEHAATAAVVKAA